MPNKDTGLVTVTGQHAFVLQHLEGCDASVAASMVVVQRYNSQLPWGRGWDQSVPQRFLPVENERRIRLED